MDIDKLRNVATNSGNLKTKVDKLDIDKLVPIPVGLGKVIDIIKKTYIMLRLKILKLKYLILLIFLVILLLTLKWMRLKTKYPVLLTWFWFGKIYGFVRVYYGTRHLVLLRSEKYDSIYDRIRYLISFKKWHYIYSFSKLCNNQSRFIQFFTSRTTDDSS